MPYDDHRSLFTDIQPILDTASQQLPALPGPTSHHTASRGHEPEYQIDTSALKRAFPDFSQYDSSEDDSVELGRGSVKDQALPSEDPTEDISLDLGADGSFRVTDTPPLKHKKSKSLIGDAVKNAASKRLTSGKENQDPLKTRGTSQRTQDRNKDHRSKNDRHAGVQSDDSLLVRRDISTTKHKAKNTRFAPTHNRQPLGESDSFPNAQPTNPDATFNSVNSANKSTHQSFMLPDLPNITELVSGARQDGTPLFSLSAKSRPRLGTPSSVRQQRGHRDRHMPIDDVHVPADERALFLSLQLLQQRVKSLENEKSQSDRKAEDYELEVLQLRSKLEESENVRQSDSGLGLDVEEEKTKEWENEKSST